VALWLTAGLGLVVAGVALALVRRLTRRVDALNQSYWELRYDYTRLRSKVAQLDPINEEASNDAVEAPAAAPSVSFVPLSSIKKKT
jgi:hypothetical protein